MAARICVMLDFGTKLPTNILLESNMGEHNQRIRYEKNIYLYHICTQVGHNESFCLAIIFVEKKEWRLKTKREDKDQDKAL